MRLDKKETEAVEYLREWAHAGFPRRADGSFPVDFLTALRRLMDLPEGFSARRLEDALAFAGPDGDYVVPRYAQRSHHDVLEDRRYLA